MGWRRLLLMVGLLISALCATGATGPKQPNVVFILADDLGYGADCNSQRAIRSAHRRISQYPARRSGISDTFRLHILKWDGYMALNSVELYE